MVENGFVKSEEELNKVVTLGVLLEYTDEFLIPKMSELMDEKILASEEWMNGKLGQLEGKFGQLEYNLKSYVDRKLDEKFTEYTLVLFKKLDARFERDRQFKDRVIAVFKKHNIGAPEDVAFLEGLLVN